MSEAEMEHVTEPLDGAQMGIINGGGAAHGEAAAPEEAGPLRRLTTSPGQKLRTTVTIGTSADYTSAFARQVSDMVNTAYGYGRLSSSEVRQRLAMGDDDDRANRVLHLAWRDGKVVGCCSSTLQTPWCPRGCGHWGLLVVDVEAQGSGVASALVSAAENRLIDAGLASVQITILGPRRK